MGQAVLECPGLPEDALGAAAAFHADYVRELEDLVTGGSDSIAVMLPAAPYDHADWRRAAARDLARAHAPARVNLVGGGDEASRAATLSYLAQAHGITGQYLPLDSEGAGNPLG